MSPAKELTIQQALSRAKKAIKKGNAAVAQQLYNSILQHSPDNPIAKQGLRKLQKGLPPKQSVRLQKTEPSQEQINVLINLFQTGQITKAEQACSELLQTYPQSLVVLNMLGETLQRQAKNQDAIQAFNKAIGIKPDFAEAYNNRGNALSDLGQAKGAVASYDKAIVLKPDFAEAYNNRGNVLRDLGQLKEAAENFEKAIEIKPDYAMAHHNLSSAKSYKSGDAQIGLLETLYTGSKTNKLESSYLCFALAKVYEDLAEYDKSFNYLTEGNLLRKKELNYDIDDDKKIIAKIKKVFINAHPAIKNESDEHASIQPLFIVGMPRSGTSLAEQILSSHTKVHGAGELNIMKKLVQPILAESYDYAIKQDTDKLTRISTETLHDDYLEALTALNVSEKIITDKMPLNFLWIGFILSAFPRAKIIHLNRNPIATCCSIYKHRFSAEGNGFAYDLLDLAEYYKHYIDLMSFWRERYPDSIYDLCYEDLTENQEEQTRKLLEFCNLEWEEQCLDFHKTKRVVNTASASQVREKMYKGSSEVWRKYEKHLQPLINNL